MRRPLIHIIVLALCLRPAAGVIAQGHHRRHPAPIPVSIPLLKATVDKQKILIGEPIQLMLEATVYGLDSLTWPPLDSMAHFEWLEKHPADSTISPGKRYYRQYLTVTSFDSGRWAIPRIPFVVGSTTFYSDSIPIQVVYTPIDPSKDYHDIKDIIEVPNPFARWFPWIVAVVALISVAIVVWLVRKKKIMQRIIQLVMAPRLSPYEEAIRDLDDLERQHLPESGSVKLFYSRLSDILRQYLYRRLGIASLSETSEELIAKIREQSLSGQQIGELAETLRMGDFVKFAKYQPGLADCDLHYRIIRQAIEELNRRVEAEELARAQAADNSTK